MNTKKVLVISNKKHKILYISKLYIGKKHDFSILKMEFPQDLPWFAAFELWLDSGFQGIQNDYTIKTLHLSARKTRAKKGQKSLPLTPEQEATNKYIAKERIYVEHAIGGLKRYRILHNKIRLKDDNTISKIINVSAGLWNLFF